jgi:hypothetical protein
MLLIHLVGDSVTKITSTDPNATPSVSQISPALTLGDRPTYAAQLAVQDSRVVGALNALIGMSAAQVTASGLPGLQSAWTAALATPTAPASENSAAGSLAAAGFTVT